MSKKCKLKVVAWYTKVWTIPMKTSCGLSDYGKWLTPRFNNIVYTDVKIPYYLISWTKNIHSVEMYLNTEACPWMIKCDIAFDNP